MLTKLYNFIKENPLPFLIILIASLLRFLYIDKVPPSLNWDEVSHGYNAFSILKTGRDEWGEFLPIIFRAYGDYKLPVYIYLTSLSEAVFGLTVFSVRLPSVLAGITSTVFVYFLADKLFNKKVGLLAMLLFAVSPWSFFVSRGAFEANLALAFIISGAYFFLKALDKKSYLSLSALLFGLSVWTYNSARIFVPLLILSLFVIYRKELVKTFKKQKTHLISFLLLISFFFIPMTLQLLNPAGQARYGWVAIIDEGAVARINEARGLSELPQTLNVLVNNKGTYFLREFGLNWISHYSPEYLFFSGGDHFQFSLPGHGLLYLINIPFFVIGLLTLIVKRDRVSTFLLSWLFLAPIPSSLTREAPHALRSITMLPIPMILSAFGVLVTVKWIKKKYKKEVVGLVFVYLVALFLLTQNYMTNYFTDYPINYSWAWQYGYEEAVDYVKGEYDEYDKVIVSKVYGEPHEFFLFHWPFSPSEYRNDESLIRFFQSDWYWVDRFDKFYFVNDWEVPDDGEFVLESGLEFNCEDETCLLITSEGNYPEGWQVVERINFLDGSTAFEILENR